MKQVKNIFNGKNAFQSIDLNDISRPIADKEHVQLQNILVEMYRDILTYCQKKDGLLIQLEAQLLERFAIKDLFLGMMTWMSEC